MEFGSQQVFDYIKFNLSNAKNEVWYERVYAVIKGDVLGYLSAYKIQDDDKDDIVQQVQVSVALHLVQFVHDSEFKSREQRNAWLRTIAKHKLMDFFRKRYKNKEDPIESVTFNFENDVRFSRNDIEETTIKTELEEKILKALSTLFSINTSPEKIIAFVFNRIIGTTERFRKNGSPKEIAQKYGSIKIHTMFEIMTEELQEIVPFSIPTYIYAPLIKKIDAATENGNVEIVFTLSPRGITDSSNWIAKKMKESKEKE